MEDSIIYSNTSITSTANTVSINNHTSSIYFLNLDDKINVVVELNGGPHRVVIPSQSGAKQYTKIEGDYTKFRIITTGISLAVFAIG